MTLKTHPQKQADRDMYNYIVTRIQSRGPYSDMWNDLWWLLAHTRFVQLPLL